MLFAEKKLFVFDMDGTVYLGNRVFPEAVKFIISLREQGKKVLFFTNNASRSAVFHIPKLERMGFEPQAGELMTSGDVTAEFLLRERPGKTVYLVGTDELCDDFRRRGITLTDGEKADIVVSSYDTSLTYEKTAKACKLIRSGSEYLCTHPDYLYPMEDGFIPDSGAIAALLTASTGVTPRFLGKPYADGINMMCTLAGVKKEEAVIFGDRLYTDIAFGKRNGVTAVLMLTGESSIADVQEAAPEQKPDFIFNDFTEIMDD